MSAPTSPSHQQPPPDEEEKEENPTNNAVKPVEDDEEPPELGQELLPETDDTPYVDPDAGLSEEELRVKLRARARWRLIRTFMSSLRGWKESAAAINERPQRWREIAEQQVKLASVLKLMFEKKAIMVTKMYNWIMLEDQGFNTMVQNIQDIQSKLAPFEEDLISLQLRLFEAITRIYENDKSRKDAEKAKDLLEKKNRTAQVALKSMEAKKGNSSNMKKWQKAKELASERENELLQATKERDDSDQNIAQFKVDNLETMVDESVEIIQRCSKSFVTYALLLKRVAQTFKPELPPQWVGVKVPIQPPQDAALLHEVIVACHAYETAFYNVVSCIYVSRRMLRDHCERAAARAFSKVIRACTIDIQIAEKIDLIRRSAVEQTKKLDVIYGNAKEMRKFMIAHDLAQQAEIDAGKKLKKELENREAWLPRPDYLVKQFEIEKAIAEAGAARQVFRDKAHDMRREREVKTSGYLLSKRRLLKQLFYDENTVLINCCQEIDKMIVVNAEPAPPYNKPEMGVPTSQLGGSNIAVELIDHTKLVEVILKNIAAVNALDKYNAAKLDSMLHLRRWSRTADPHLARAVDQLTRVDNKIAAILEEYSSSYHEFIANMRLMLMEEKLHDAETTHFLDTEKLLHKQIENVHNVEDAMREAVLSDDFIQRKNQLMLEYRRGHMEHSMATEKLKNVQVLFEAKRMQLDVKRREILSRELYAMVCILEKLSRRLSDLLNEKLFILHTVPDSVMPDHVWEALEKPAAEEDITLPAMERPSSLTSPIVVDEMDFEP